MTAATATRFAAAIGGFEGMPAATARNGVGIVDGKACAHQTINIIDFTASNIAKAHLVYQHFEIALQDDGIAILLFVKGRAVLETRATATRDEDAQAQAGIIFLRNKSCTLLAAAGVMEMKVVSTPGSWVCSIIRFASLRGGNYQPPIEYTILLHMSDVIHVSTCQYYIL